MLKFELNSIMSFGRVLEIDLSSRDVKRYTVDSNTVKKYLGGRGIGLYLIYKMGLKVEDVDPYGAENPLIIASGPLCGTRIPMSSRTTAVFKSPLTNRWNYSTVGGSLAAYMRYSGVDILVLKGVSEKPTYIVIEGDSIEFKDASNLWGLDTMETESKLRREYSDSAVITIGPAGENLIPYAIINHEYWREFGREGAGAVMGSKKVKAVIFKPVEKSVGIADESMYKEVLRDLLKKCASPLTAFYREKGTPGAIDIANKLGFFPTYYWTEVRLPNWEDRISWEKVIKERYLVKHEACLYCPVACRKRVRSSKYNIEHDIDYEEVYSIAGLTGVSDMDDVIYLADLIDRMGLDVITLGNVIGFTIYLSKKGVLKEKFEWGDTNAIKELIINTAKRVGLGELTSLGVKNMAEKLNVANEAIHVKGLEPAGYDPRTLKGMALNNAIAERGADHVWSSAYVFDMANNGARRFEVSEAKVKDIMDLEERNTIYDSAILCKFGRGVYDWQSLVNALNAVTGFNYTIDELRDVARRIIILQRYMNKTSIEDDGLPARWFKETVKLNGVECIVKEDEWRYMVSKYYELRGYDDRGIPKEDTLRNLGIIE